MTTHARLTLIMTLICLLAGAGALLAQTPDEPPPDPGGGSASGAGPAGAAGAVLLDNEKEKEICEKLCSYKAAPWSPAAAAKLAKEIEPLIPQTSKEITGECDCPDGTTLTYQFQKSSGDVNISGSQDIVMAFTTDKDGSAMPSTAKATNTGSGDAIAAAGSNNGSGPGGAATATAGSGNAFAAGGDSGKSGSKQGGSGAATSATGNAGATGGKGGSNKGSTTKEGGTSGTASATHLAEGMTYIKFGPPLLDGMHGTSTSVSFKATLIQGSNPPRYTLAPIYGGGKLVPN